MPISPQRFAEEREYSYQASVEDALLADVAVRVQLTPADYLQAVERYETIGKFLENHSDLPGPILGIFPQGSMATGTTVAARGDEEFDIDLVADLGAELVWQALSPAQVLDRFFDAFGNSRRYGDMVERKTRCVTITYADGMHLDVTPLQLRDSLGHGQVMHHRYEERSRHPHGRHVPSTPRGFADWFERQMPDEVAFGRFFEGRAIDFARAKALEAKAEVDEVPDQEPAYRKPRAKVCLQLIKRFRNIRYEGRYRRMPPSILLSKLVAEEAARGIITDGLHKELLRIVDALLQRFSVSDTRGSLIVEWNPEDDDELLTDRWPDDHYEQMLFATDLMELETKLVALQRVKLPQKLAILEEMFGEKPARQAMATIQNGLARNISAGKQAFTVGGTGNLLIGGKHDSPSTHVPRQNSFYGK